MKNKKRIKQIFAWIGIVILIGMYIATFLLAFFHNPLSQALFRGSLALTVLLPVLLYAMQLIFRLLNRDDKQDNSKK